MPVADDRFDVLYFGKVVERKDPKKLGRIRARIPGLAAKTDWARPAGVRAAGPGLGEIDPPRLGAFVLVGFEAGERKAPFFFSGFWAAGETPPGHVVDEDGGDNAVFANEVIVIETDTRTASKGWRVKDRATDGAKLQIDFDPVTNQVGITGTVGIRIQTTGAVRIKGGSVSINDRLVRPGGKPI